MANEYDLTAASHMLGKLIDPAHQRRIHRERITGELITRARNNGIALEATDIRWVKDEPEIDGMPADQWLDAMTMD